ncbi:hypothetical protein PACTADRAFT_51879 [Pachysolen tannophilus NRRL Y-2460]|uniref:Uncharacterized protein n=1 Tax=Pachysolen tannophilus NRRL Y-2460 TaxID=669874 RepID=A0A1E4TNC5_PACTA|nr:hypothetical protein PACTADRAFT_51879 [Pachysolen tannophilus NRRL Y-2460]
MIIFRPPKYDAIDHEKNLKESDGLKFATEIYKGQRSLSAIVEFVLSRIKNYVKKLHNFDQINKYIQGRTKTNKSKILLLTDKNKPTPLIKSIAIDYLSSFETAYITIKKNEKDEIFDFFKIDKDIAKLPQIIIIDTKDNPNEKEEIIVYDGDLNKVALSHYLSNFATPLEGPASKRMDLLNKHKNINNSQNNKKDKNKKKKNSKNTANAHDEL